MVTKTCKQCGCTMTVTNNRIRLCDSCKEHNRKEHYTTYMKKYIKDNRHHLVISKEDNEILEKISSITGMSKTKIVHVLLENFMENI